MRERCSAVEDRVPVLRRAGERGGFGGAATAGTGRAAPAAGLVSGATAGLATTAAATRAGLATPGGAGLLPQALRQPQPAPPPQYQRPAYEPPPQRRAAPQQQAGPPPQQPPGRSRNGPVSRPAQYALRPATGSQGPPQQRTGPPTWLMGVAFALAFLGILAGVYYFFQRSGRPNTAEKAGLENPSSPSQQKVRPIRCRSMWKWVSIRMVTENKKPVAKFVVVNHSGRGDCRPGGERDALGQHVAFGRRFGGLVRFQGERPRRQLFEGTDRAVEDEAQAVRTAGLAEHHGGDSDYFAAALAWKAEAPDLPLRRRQSGRAGGLSGRAPHRTPGCALRSRRLEPACAPPAGSPSDSAIRRTARIQAESSRPSG